MIFYGILCKNTVNRKNHIKIGPMCNKFYGFASKKKKKNSNFLQCITMVLR